jgi:hypothetical protein
MARKRKSSKRAKKKGSKRRTPGRAANGRFRKKK